MKYFFSSLFYVFCFIILAFALFSINANSFNRSKDNAGAFNDSASTLTWYGANNQPIYNIDIPYGYSFNQISNNNILENSSFLNFPNGTYPGVSGTSPFVNGWYSYGNGGNIQIISDDNGIHFNSSYNSFIFIPLDNVVAGTYYCNLIAGGVLYTGSVNVVDVTFTTYFSIEFNGLARIFCRIAYRTTPFISGYNYTFEVYVFSNNSIDIQAVSLSNLNLPYFNQDYIDFLYRNTGGVISSDYIWSMSKVNTIVYDSSLINNVSANFYYIKDRPVISIVDNFGTMFRDISDLTNSFTTYSCLQNLKSTFNSFNNMDFNFSSSHKKDFGYGISTVNVLGYVSDLVQYVIMWLLNICKLVFFAISLLVCPLIDSVALLFYVFGGVDLWFYLS